MRKTRNLCAFELYKALLWIFTQNALGCRETTLFALNLIH